MGWGHGWPSAGKRAGGQAGCRQAHWPLAAATALYAAPVCSALNSFPRRNDIIPPPRRRTTEEEPDRGKSLSSSQEINAINKTGQRKNASSPLKPCLPLPETGLAFPHQGSRPMGCKGTRDTHNQSATNDELICHVQKIIFNPEASGHISAPAAEGLRRVWEHLLASKPAFFGSVWPLPLGVLPLTGPCAPTCQGHEPPAGNQLPPRAQQAAWHAVGQSKRWGRKQWRRQTPTLAQATQGRAGGWGGQRTGAGRSGCSCVQGAVAGDRGVGGCWPDTQGRRQVRSHIEDVSECVCGVRSQPAWDLAL